MKNQNDLICIVVCSVLAVVGAVVMFFMKREPVAPAPPQAVLTADPTYPTGAGSTWANSLPGGSNSSAGGFAGFGGGMGPGGMGGPGGMRGGPGGPPPGIGMPPGATAGGMGGGKRALAKG